MRPRTEILRDWCQSGVLPEKDVVYATLIEDDQFTSAEGPNWDFKEEWPFSLSNEYFAGIARLICAFGNSGGGCVIFGVHDKKRTGGHNKVAINFDRFSQALNQLLDDIPQIAIKSYKSEVYGDIDVLLVRPRPSRVKPYRFNKTVGKYTPKHLWVRSGHEVVVAAPPHFPVLFCRVDQRVDPENLAELDGSIPPSPATMKRFVGRTSVLDQLFQWLESSDEPRTYLHGKGGSGKTTIAYEFARLIKNHGSNIRSFGGETIDAVIFLSAKEKALVPVDGVVVEINDPDFASERDIIFQILHYGGWTNSLETIRNATLEELRSELIQLLDMNSLLLVVDDIDTLTTKGIDPGSDFLYRALCRSKRLSKVVYTLRNAPTQSLTNSIEVPGLDDVEYDQFVAECSRQFSVPAPDRHFKDSVLPQLSERRPLVVESVIALVRTAGSYSRAAELFTQHAGDNVRDYVFVREWDALNKETLAKLFLAALAEMNGPASFAEIQTVLQAEVTKVRDAIGEVREMFLQIDEAGHEARYWLAPLTRSFVSSRKQELVGYGVLHQRVKAFKRHVKFSSPRVTAIALQVERLLPARANEHSSDRAVEAYRVVSDSNLPPLVTEDPLFRSVYGFVCACLSRPRLVEAREAFQYAIDMKHEAEYRYLQAWFNAEKESGAHDGWCIKIANIVLEGKRYTEYEKRTMVGRKAISFFARGRERLHINSTDALSDFEEALRLHLRAFRLMCNAGDYRAETYENFARNTAYQLFQHLGRSEAPWEIIDRIKAIASEREVFLDPLEGPIADGCRTLVATHKRPELVHRLKGRMRGLVELLSDRERWLAGDSSTRVVASLRHLEGELAKFVQRAPAA